MPHRRSQPSAQPFEGTPLDVIIDGIGRQQKSAARQNQALATLNRVPSAAQPAGPAALTLNGEVLDENTIPSVRDLGNLRDNPEIPQLIQDRFLVSDQAGQVRVLPEPGEDPRIAESFTPDMLAGVEPSASKPAIFAQPALGATAPTVQPATLSAEETRMRTLELRDREAFCQTREALVAEIASTGQLLAAYGYDDALDDQYYIFLVFTDWTGALLVGGQQGLFCEANVLSRSETLGLAAEIEAKIGAAGEPSSQY